jgi:hypothetical protein
MSLTEATQKGTDHQAPAISEGGAGPRDAGGKRAGRTGCRKKMHAVTASPRELASVVRRSVTSRANTLTTCRQPWACACLLSSQGQTNTSKIKKTDNPMVSRKSNQGNQDGDKPLMVNPKSETRNPKQKRNDLPSPSVMKMGRGRGILVMVDERSCLDEVVFYFGASSL